MPVKKNDAVTITANLMMQGELKVEGNVRVENNLQGRLKAKGVVTIASGTKVVADVVAAGLLVEPGGALQGKLQIGEARKPLGRMRGWFRAGAKQS